MSGQLSTTPGESDTHPDQFSTAPYRVIVASPRWTLNGVNVFNLNLVRGLLGRGIEARVLLTEEATELVPPNDPEMTRPPEVPFDELAVQWWEGWGAHWGATIRYLESQAPCVYVPNYDYRHSCVSPRLSPRVSIVGVVHSDDPLHYEHVSRLGEYWDAIVCVSATLGDRTKALCPTLSERVRTIPIGIAIPARRPTAVPDSEGVLRVIYHGVLKQHQKRILDLPRVVAALEARGVPVRLSIAGGGPEDEELRRASAAHVDRESIRFLGVVPHDRIPELLAANDVYLLTSEFEGMPNALLEAMANGCVPVVSDMESGIPELVRDGDNGFLVGIGDIESFADRLALLQADPLKRDQMSEAAYAGVSQGAFSSDDMLGAYVEVFDRVTRRAREGDFVRPGGDLLPPPAKVGDVGIFQSSDDTWEWELSHAEEGVGRFPTRQDYRDFERHLTPAATTDAAGLKVIAGAPFWTDNWSNIKCQELLGGLSRLGADVRLLLTEERTDHVTVTELPLPLPDGYPVVHLAVSQGENWGGHWGAMVRYLQAQAPCIYLPTHDWRHACVAGQLSGDVTIVGTVSNDPLHMEQAERLGEYWDAAVVPDMATARSLERRVPDLAGRVHLIRSGLDVPDVHELAGDPTTALVDPAPMRVVVFEPFERGFGSVAGLTELQDRLRERSISIDLSIVGSHPEHGSTLALFRPGPDEGSRQLVEPLSHTAMLERFDKADVVVSRPPDGALPEDLCRAMGRACVLVIATAESSALLRDGANAMMAPDGPTLIECLARLSSQAELRAELAAAAHQTAARMFRVENMAEAYAELFRDLIPPATSEGSRRVRGELRPPPAEVEGIGVFPVDLSYHVPGIGRFPSRSDYRRFRGQLGALQSLRGWLTRAKG